MVAANSSKKLSDEEVSKLDQQASNNWDKFYGIHQVNKHRCELKDKTWSPVETKKNLLNKNVTKITKPLLYPHFEFWALRTPYQKPS